MVNYRFDAMPRALQVAIPYTYDDTLFETGPDKKQTQVIEQERADEATLHQQADEKTSHHNDRHIAEEQQQALEQVNALLDHGRKVKVIGATPNPGKKHTYIIAGGTPKGSTGENKPVAVALDDNTTIIKRTGEHVPPTVAKGLQEGGLVVVEGKQSKRGVIQAKRVVII